MNHVIVDLGKNINDVAERYNIRYRNTNIAENPAKTLNLFSFKNFINKSNLPDVCFKLLISSGLVIKPLVLPIFKNLFFL